MIAKLRFLLVCLLLIGFLPVKQAQAARGLPGTTEFGYGAWLHPEGDYFDQGLALLQDLALDWVAIDLDWASMYPSPDAAANFANLDRAVSTAARSGTAVLISLTNPPDWATSDTGPDPDATTALVLALTEKYGDQLCALELFPGANTAFGWHAAPDPAAYAALWAFVRQNLDAAGSSLPLMTGGLRPLAANASPADWNDLDFLHGLYAAGAKDWMEVLSIQFPQLTGQPLQTTSEGGIFLRHYEAVRQVMLDYGHTNGRIWVTLISPPDGTINASDSFYADKQHQTEWLQQAVIQLRSQLYMGAVIVQSLNPGSGNSSIFSQDALVQGRSSVHPFYAVYKAILRQTNPESGTARPGRPKGTTLLKCKYKT